MYASLFHDESRRLTCQAIRLDWRSVVGFRLNLYLACWRRPRALSNAMAPCSGAASSLSWGLDGLLVQAVASCSEG
jgi:hypothetical protein